MQTVFLGWDGNDAQQIAFALHDALLDTHENLKISFFQPSQDNLKTLHKKIKEIEVFFLVLTPTNIHSHYLLYLIALLIDKNIQVFPLLFSIEAKKIPFHLKEIELTTFQEDEYQKLFVNTFKTSNIHFQQFWNSFETKTNTTLNNYNEKFEQKNIENSIDEIKNELKLLTKTFNSFNAWLTPVLRDDHLYNQDTKPKNSWSILIDELTNNGLLNNNQELQFKEIKELINNGILDSEQKSKLQKVISLIDDGSFTKSMKNELKVSFIEALKT